MNDERAKGTQKERKNERKDGIQNIKKKNINETNNKRNK